MIGRRALLAAGAAAVADPALAATSPDLRVRGSRAYSESAMVMSVAPDGSSALTLRVCRFPDEDQTWLWCHLFADGELYAFTRHDLPASRERFADADQAAYRAPPARAELSRTGRGETLSDVRLSANLRFHRSRAAPHGPGDVRGRIEARFYPVEVLAGAVLAGRDEVYGACRAQVEIDGRRFVHEGPAKFHEQRQEAPRFEAPFCYAWLAGDGAAATTLLVARGAAGGWRLKGLEAPLADMAIDRPRQRRGAAWSLRDGRLLTGRLTSLVRYEIPVYNQKWRGSFVRGDLDGRPIVGAVNDWIAEPDIYAAANARMWRP